jgi:hypothetical protein
LAPSPLLEEDGTLRIWYAGHNVADIVGTDTSYNVTIDPFGLIQVLPGYYGIGMSSFQFPEMSVSSNYADDQQIQVFPNPSSGQINIQLENIAQETTVYINNSIGQLVKEPFILSNGKHSVDLESLKSGIYFVLLKNEASSKMYKIELKE